MFLQLEPEVFCHELHELTRKKKNKIIRAFVANFFLTLIQSGVNQWLSFLSSRKALPEGSLCAFVANF